VIHTSLIKSDLYIYFFPEIRRCNIKSLRW